MSNGNTSNETEGRSKPSQSTRGWRDYLEATKRISPADDLTNMANVPCTRNSLLAGIASGVGVGFIRSMNTKMIYAGNWAVVTFALVSITSWNICRNRIIKERQTMQWVKDEAVRQRAARRQSENGTSQPSQ